MSSASHHHLHRGHGGPSSRSLTHQSSKLHKKSSVTKAPKLGHMSSSRIFPNPSHTVALSIEEEIKLMTKAETEQTVVDRFWGLDKQLKDIEEERDKMMEEEKRSIALDNYIKKIQIVAIWEENDRQARLEEAYLASVEEEYARKMYLEEFNLFANSLDVVRYEWPTKPHVRPAQKEREDENTAAANQDFVIRETFSNKSTIHVDGIQQAKVLAENLAASMTLQKSPAKKPVMEDEEEEVPESTKVLLQSLHSRASSPVLQTALEGQSGMFDRPKTPLTKLVDAQTAAAEAAKEHSNSRGVSQNGRPETTSPTMGAASTSTVSRPKSPPGSKRGDALFKNQHLKQLGEAYAAEEALLGKIESGSYIPALHGHKQYKWEMQTMLKIIFETVVQEHQHGNLSKTMSSATHHKKPDVITYAQLIKSIASAVISSKGGSSAVPEPRTATGKSSKVKALRTMSASDMIAGRHARPPTPVEAAKVNILDLFKYTLFGTWIKCQDFHLFELLFDVTPGTGGRALTLRDWLVVVKAASHEDHVPANRIRTPNEHKQVSCTEYRMQLAEADRKASSAADPTLQVDETVSKKLYAAGARSYSVDKISRESGQLYRAAAVGDAVWAQYGSGVTWLPGVIANKYDEDQSFEIYYTLSEKEQMELQIQISSKIVIEGYYQHSDKVLEKSNAQLKQSLNLSIPGIEEVEEPSESQGGEGGSRRSSAAKPSRPLTRPSTEVDDRAFFKYVFSQLTQSIPSHSGSFDTEALIEKLVSPQCRQLISGSKILALLIDGHATATAGAENQTEEEKQAAKEAANATSLVGILAEQPSTSESEFVELCACLSDLLAYQN